MNTRLEKFYKEEVVPKLMKQFGYSNPMEVPKLTKITLNMGVGEAATNKKILENAVTNGFWPPILAMSATAFSRIFLLVAASPTPMFRVIFVSLGTSIGLE